MQVQRSNTLTDERTILNPCAQCDKLPGKRAIPMLVMMKTPAIATDGLRSWDVATPPIRLSGGGCQKYKYPFKAYFLSELYPNKTN